MYWNTVFFTKDFSISTKSENLLENILSKIRIRQIIFRFVFRVWTGFKSNVSTSSLMNSFVLACAGRSIYPLIMFTVAIFVVSNY